MKKENNLSFDPNVKRYTAGRKRSRYRFNPDSARNRRNCFTGDNVWVYFYYYLLAEIVFTSTSRWRRPQKLTKVTYTADRKLEIPTRRCARLPPPPTLLV